MFRIYPRIVFIMWVLADFHSALTRLDKSYQTLGNVARLALDVEDQATAVTKIGIGAIEKKQIGKVGCAHAQVGPGIVGPPRLSR